MKTMKNLISIIIILLIVNISVGQQPIDKVFTVHLPKNTHQITKSDYVNQLRSNWHHPKLPRNIEDIQEDNIVKANNLYILIKESKIDQMLQKDLIGQKNELTDFFKLDKSIEVKYYKVLDVNNLKYLVYEYHDGDEFWLCFSSEYHNDCSILGSIQFKEFDETDAQNELTKILNGINLSDAKFN